MKIKCHKCDKMYENKRSLIKKYNNFMICFICYHEDTYKEPIKATKEDAINYLLGIKKCINSEKQVTRDWAHYAYHSNTF